MRYYYTPDAKATDFKKEAKKKADDAKKKADAAKKKTDATKKKPGTASNDTGKTEAGADNGAKQSPDTTKGAPKDKNAMDGGEQISMFGSPQAADKAA